jgi:2-polyprenyl-6-hydroxyphenyl methylase/3-demethylubiquinone-9 3-methyltransferase
MKINNEVYDQMANYWWDENECGTLATIRTFVNPARFSYFNSVLKNLYHNNFQKLNLLDVGCGGGFLSEEFSKIGLNVTRVDPSEKSINVAQNHANRNNLKIRYVQCFGEKLPFESNSFSIVSCCDVLEHVSDLNIVIKEISRVLVPGGIFLYDTINRTLIGKIMLKATQEWKSTAFMEPNVHVYELFVKPKELFHFLKLHNLNNIEIKGMSPSTNILSSYINLRKCKRGEISYKELGDKLNIRLNNNTLGSYVGYAIKTNSL